MFTKAMVSEVLEVIEEVLGSSPVQEWMIASIRVEG